MKISILGKTLYAGVLAGLLAESGHQVIWCPVLGTHFKSVNYSSDEQLNRLLHIQQQNGQLVYSDNFSEISDIDVYFIAVNSTEFEMAQQAVLQLKNQSNQPKLIVNGSTFGLHGTEKLRELSPEYQWAYLPDIIQEGQAVSSFVQLKQIIVGIEQASSLQYIQEVLRPIFPLKQQFLTMPILDAEFTKLSVSGMLATRISYMNDLAQVAEKLGIDILNVRQGLASDGRIGSIYLSAGAGFGGENFSNDILTLANTVLNTGVKSRLLDQVWQINESQKEVLFRKLWHYYQGHLADKTIAIWGASFKENTSSIAYSPTLALIDALLAQGAKVQLHDPQALGEIARYYGENPQLILCQDIYQATEHSDALCLMTAWKCYLSPDFRRLKNQMKQLLILDGRNIYDPDFVRVQGFEYMGVGRK